jgi:phosphoribosylamine---glycine ligase
MNVLLIGGGGREHAIAWKLRQSSLLTDLHIAPGNAGTAQVGHNLELPIPRTGAAQAEVDSYLDAAASLALDLKVDLVFVAPDDPLAWGLVDRCEAAGVAAFGPSKAAALLEASKAWAKEFAARHRIPSTTSCSFHDLQAARAHVLASESALVVKADGLAAGKGAIVTNSTVEALAAVEELMAGGVLGEAGRRVVIEERLVGREVSAHAFSDGRTIAPMPLSCDHKTVFDGGEGPNTGGMGVYSPPWWAGEGLEEQIRRQVLQPAADGMREEGRPFRGVLYPGVFVTDSGLRVFEFNARMGDPEAQALLPRLQTDLLEIACACANGTLHQVKVEWDDRATVCVVIASGGYPGSYTTGLPISGLDDIDDDVQVFHAGTRLGADGGVVTAGGRVLSVVAAGSTLELARGKAYANVERISFEGAHFRRDIGVAEPS